MASYDVASNIYQALRAGGSQDPTSQTKTQEQKLASKGFIELKGEAVKHEMTEADPSKHAVDLSKIPLFDEPLDGTSSKIPRSLGDMGGDEGGGGSGVHIMQKTKKGRKGGKAAAVEAEAGGGGGGGIGGAGGGGGGGDGTFDFGSEQSEQAWQGSGQFH